MAKSQRVVAKTVSITKEMPRVSKLRHAADVAIKDILAVREGEEVLIITNLEGEAFTIAREFYAAARAAGGKAVMMVQPEQSMADIMPRLVVNAINDYPDVLIGIFSNMLGQDSYGVTIGYVGRDGKKYSYPHLKVSIGDRRTRCVVAGWVNADMFERMVPIDYTALRARAGRLKEILDNGKEAHITARAGTDLTLSIEGRKVLQDVGDAQTPGVFGNIPCGEVCICPALASCRGVIVFDGTLTLETGCILPKAPVRVTMKDGYVDRIEGGEEAKLLIKAIEYGEKLAKEKGDAAALKNARHIGELGIGLNPAARMCGNLMEDEKLLHTVHLAIGMDYDGLAHAFIHLDCLVKDPSMWVDGKQVMKDGDLLI